MSAEQTPAHALEARSAVPDEASDGTNGEPRLPLLREPPGWRSLDQAELGTRTLALFGAALGSLDDSKAVPPENTQSTASPPQRTLEVEAAPAAVHRQRKRAPAALAAPWLVLAGGLAMSAPVLVWTPLAGGLCVGIALLQAGLVRRWLGRYESATSPADSVRAQPGEAQFLPEPDTAAPVPKIRTGLLLASFLALFGLLAAIVLATLDLKNREPAAAAEAVRRQHQPESPREEGDQPARAQVERQR